MKRKQFRALKAGDIVKVKYQYDQHHLVLIEEIRCLGRQWDNLYEASGKILSSKVFKEGIDWHLVEEECVSYELIA